MVIALILGILEVLALLTFVVLGVVGILMPVTAMILATMLLVLLLATVITVMRTKNHKQKREFEKGEEMISQLLPPDSRAASGAILINAVMALDENIKLPGYQEVRKASTQNQLRHNELDLNKDKVTLTPEEQKMLENGKKINFQFLEYTQGNPKIQKNSKLTAEGGRMVEQFIDKIFAPFLFNNREGNLVKRNFELTREGQKIVKQLLLTFLWNNKIYVRPSDERETKLPFEQKQNLMKSMRKGTKLFWQNTQLSEIQVNSVPTPYGHVMLDEFLYKVFVPFLFNNHKNSELVAENFEVTTKGQKMVEELLVKFLKDNEIYATPREVQSPDNSHSSTQSSSVISQPFIASIVTPQEEGKPPVNNPSFGQSY